jgi:peptidoglycan/xylan/chitin deacetylase (PgdA/CDA1 family)
MGYMKHRIRDSFIWLISVLGIVRLYRWRKKKKWPLVRVIAFHDVDDVEWFESVVKMLHEQYNILTPRDFHQKLLDENKINVLVTFDDGYQSWIDVVLPVLETYKIKGLFFVSSGLLNAADDPHEAAKFTKECLLLSHERELLTWEGAENLLRAGHTIGGHTQTHPDLATLEGAELCEEIAGDKRELERKLDIRLRDFAYPFGKKCYCSDAAHTAAGVAGYSHLYTAEPGFFQDRQGTEDIPRMLIENNQSLGSLKRWMEGGYDLFSVFR